MMILKNTFKSYFKSLVYIFIPLGTLFLGLIIGGSIFFDGANKMLNTFLSDFSRITKDYSLDYKALFEFIINSFSELNWNDPINTIGYLLSSSFLVDKINEFAATASTIYGEYASEITAAASAAVSLLVPYIIFLFVFIVLGLIGGFFLTKFLIRRDNAKRTIWKTILAYLVSALFSSTLVVFCTWLISYWKSSIFFSAIFSVILFGLLSLFEAYIVQGRKKVEMKKVINIKNSLLLFVSYIIYLTLSGLILLAIKYIFRNNFILFACGIPLAIITLVLIDIDAESYVYNLSLKSENLTTTKVEKEISKDVDNKENKDVSKDVEKNESKDVSKETSPTKKERVKNGKAKRKESVNS